MVEMNEERDRRYMGSRYNNEELARIAAPEIQLRARFSAACDGDQARQRSALAASERVTRWQSSAWSVRPLLVPEHARAGLRSFLELVENRRREARYARLGHVTVEIEHLDVIAAAMQPRAGQIQRLLRSDAPVAAEVDAVHEDDAAVPATHVEERIAGRSECERPTKHRWAIGRGRAAADARCRVEREAEHRPTGERRASERDRLDDALAIVDELG